MMLANERMLFDSGCRVGDGGGWGQNRKGCVQLRGRGRCPNMRMLRGKGVLRRCVWVNPTMILWRPNDWKDEDEWKDRGFSFASLLNEFWLCQSLIHWDIIIWRINRVRSDLAGRRRGWIRESSETSFAAVSTLSFLLMPM
mgnify:CR=1 FL=1